MHVHKTLCPFYTITKMPPATQGRNEGGKRGTIPLVPNHYGGAKSLRGVPGPPLENFSPPLEKCIGHRLKLLDIVQKIWAPLRKHSPLVTQAGYGPGARHKVPAMSQILSSMQYICFRKISGSHMEGQTCFLPRAPSNLVTPLLLRQQSQESCFLGAEMLLFTLRSTKLRSLALLAVTDSQHFLPKMSAFNSHMRQNTTTVTEPLKI